MTDKKVTEHLVIGNRAFPRRVFALALAALLAGIVGVAALGASKRHKHLDSRLPHADAKAASAVASKKQEQDKDKDGVDKDRKFIAVEGTEEVDHPEGNANWRWHLLTYPTGRMPDSPFSKAKAWMDSHVQQAPLAAFPQGGLTAPEAEPLSVISPGASGWTFYGPRPIDMTSYNGVTGRFNAVAVDPRTVNNAGAIKAFAGAASGGLWKTTNCCGSGTTWTSLLDNFYSGTQAIGAIEFDPNNPDVIYAGTGDGDAADQFGEGILKSTDGGNTWVQYGIDTFTPNAAGTPLYANQNARVIKVDPRNSNNVLVGTRFDLYISHDGGVTWLRCPFGANEMDPALSSIDPSKAINRISGIFMDPATTPTTVYVAVGYTSSYYNGNDGVYKGTMTDSGCLSLALKNTGWPAGTGSGINAVNGGANVGNIRLAGSWGNAGGTLTLYAQVHNTSTDGALGTYVTRDNAATWTLLSGTTDANDTQDWYDLFIVADPQNDKTLYVGRMDLYRMTVNSSYTSATKVSLGGYSGHGLHPDQHDACWIKGTGNSAQLLEGNDGGLYNIQLTSATASTNTSLNSTVNATQWYAGQISQNFAQVGGASTQILWAGAQDNGTASWDSSQGTTTWQTRQGGDGMFAAFDAAGGTLSSGVWMGEYYSGSIYRSASGATGTYSTVTWGGNGDRKGWSTPFRFDVFHSNGVNCKNVICGSQYLYANATSGQSDARFTKYWISTSGTTDLTKGSGSIVSLDFAPTSPTAAVIGTDDGTVQVSFDIYTGTNCTQALANTASFACTPNDAATWINLTQGNVVLPNRAIMGVTFDPTTVYSDPAAVYMIYAAVSGFNPNTPATPGHVFQAKSLDHGVTWTWFDKTGNLPDVPAESIVINPNNASQAFVGTDIGFFFTNDIMAESPIWYSYNYGLPSTIIQYLTLDRGPSANPYHSTTLAAFTYGRGTYAIRLPAAGGFLPYPVKNTMTATKNGSVVDIIYPLTCKSAQNNVYWGTIGDYSSVTGGQCQVGNSGTASGVAIPDNSWFVITGASDGTSPPSIIASFGKDSSGYERNFAGWENVTGCTAYSEQDTQTQCQ